MSNYTATISWFRNSQPFTDNQYKRVHKWQFDSGQIIKASASPNIVPTPLSDPSGVDPEEAFVASLSSCHMLWFLSIAAKQGFVIDRYVDQAEGVLAKNTFGKQAITQVTLFPRVSYGKRKFPAPEEDKKIHRQASERCFIANSVKTNINIEPSIEKVS